MRVFCDFDGTVTTCDTTDLILSCLADPAWEPIEAEWVEGRIDAATCMRRQIALIGAPRAEIDAVLDTVELRDGFVAFLDWARAEDVPVTIVSDGVDYFIEHILARHGIFGMRVIANRLVSAGEGWALEQPWRSADCGGGSGVCKCAVVAAFADDRPLVFVGDGRSDFCVANKPDLLFATAGLGRFCVDRNIAHRPFENFGEIQSALAAITVDRRAFVRA